MPDPRLPKIKKAFDPKDSNPCESCSNCCEYIAIEIDKPTTFQEFDEIYWYLVHKDVWVYVDDDDDWYVQFNTRCEKLEDRRCSFYFHRPQICRDYSPNECVRYGEGEPEKFLFKNENDLFEYLAKKRPKMLEKMIAKVNVPAKVKV